jgi:hypothetical protein
VERFGCVRVFHAPKVTTNETDSPPGIK